MNNIKSNTIMLEKMLLVLQDIKAGDTPPKKACETYGVDYGAFSAFMDNDLKSLLGADDSKKYGKETLLAEKEKLGNIILYDLLCHTRYGDSSINIGNIFHLKELYEDMDIDGEFPEDIEATLKAIIKSIGGCDFAEEYYLEGKSISQIAVENGKTIKEIRRNLKSFRAKIEQFKDNYLKNGLAYYHSDDNEAVCSLNLPEDLKRYLYNNNIFTVRDLSKYSREQVKDIMRLHLFNDADEFLDALEVILKRYGCYYSSTRYCPLPTGRNGDVTSGLYGRNRKSDMTDTEKPRKRNIYGRDNPHNLVLISETENPSQEKLRKKKMEYCDVTLGNVVHMVELYSSLCIYTPFPKDAVESVKAILNAYRKNKELAKFTLSVFREHSGYYRVEAEDMDSGDIADVGSDYYVEGKEKEVIARERNMDIQDVELCLHILWELFESFSSTYLKFGMAYYLNNNDEALEMLSMKDRTRNALRDWGMHTVRGISYCTREQVENTLEIFIKRKDTIRAIVDELEKIIGGYGYSYSAEKLSRAETSDKLNDKGAINKGLTIPEYEKRLEEFLKK